MTREELLITLAAQVLVLPDTRAQLVAISGTSCVGKSHLADDLIPIVEGAGRAVVRIDYDDFHSPRAVRHRQDRLSASGYLEDAYDAESLRRLVIDPVRGEAAEVTPASFDLARDEPVEASAVPVPADGVVVVEGEFLLAPHFADAWDLAVLLVAEPGPLLERALVRDRDLGTPQQVRELYLRRYLGAWALHEEQHDPWSRADVVVDVTNPAQPRLLSGA